MQGSRPRVGKGGRRDSRTGSPTDEHAARRRSSSSLYAANSRRGPTFALCCLSTRVDVVVELVVRVDHERPPDRCRSVPLPTSLSASLNQRCWTASGPIVSSARDLAIIFGRACARHGLDRAPRPSRAPRRTRRPRRAAPAARRQGRRALCFQSSRGAGQRPSSRSRKAGRRRSSPRTPRHARTRGVQAPRARTQLEEHREWRDT